jgi:diaminopimelate decarboxylase
MEQFPVVDNCLHISGRPLDSVISEVGRTPFYAYDSSVMTTQVQKLRSALPGGVHLHYAMKANPMPAVVQHLSEITDGLDVASAGELEVALATGTDPLHISFAGPGKSDADLAAAVAAGVIINMESEGEMARIAALSEAHGKIPRVAIRVNPDFELKTSGMKMGGGAKPFGVDAERVPAMLAELGTLPLDFMGFHIFSGSQNLRTEAIIEAQTKTFELAFRLTDAAPRPPRWLNIGGGLGIPYFPGEKRLDLAPIAANLELVCQVVDRKVSRGETFIITNGGLHHHLAVSGNFGQVIRKNYPVCIGNRVRAEHTEVVSVVGPLCTPLDILADKMELSPANVGDYVVIFQSGAYGYSASPHQFLSHPPPLEIFI